ncbi:rod shape-determining protein MreC [Coriobacteriales bacterium OH1046]|nr:rod shape-determining protein MreC [Coriobacteriales bacterium OH1046]
MATGRVTGSGLSGTTPSTGGRALIILVAVSLSLFTASVRSGDTGVLGALRGGFSAIAMPFRVAGSVLTAPIYGLGNIFANLTADQATLSELRAENEALRQRNIELEEKALLADRLAELMEIQSTYNLQSIAAKVISGSTDSWTSTITIDKGSSAGLSVGMPVVDASGVIGQIISVSPTTSVVRLAYDENSSIPAMIQSNRAQGILSGSASGGLSLDLVRSDLTVNVDDVVVTSGLGGVYPKGLPIGRVTSVERSAGALYLEVAVEAFSRVQALEEVIVITSLTDEQHASAEDIEEADAQEMSAVDNVPEVQTLAQPSDGDGG